MNEFDIIRRFFTEQKIKRDDVILASGDDCAIVKAPRHQRIAITTDTLIAGVHFPLQTSAYDIGYKALAVNLSDLAAMGATPAWASMALTLPHIDETWLQDFAKGFFDLASEFHVQLIGGDLTRGALSITITAQGFVPNDAMLTRSGANVGDLIYVTNTIGDAAFALTHPSEKTLPRLNRPYPQVNIGKALLNVATAAIDISDGLLADLQHILEKSGVGARINLEKIPLSEELAALPLAEAFSFALNGGDDYQLCFTAPRHMPLSIGTCIGEIMLGKELTLYLNNEKYEQNEKGYRHF